MLGREPGVRGHEAAPAAETEPPAGAMPAKLGRLRALPQSPEVDQASGDRRAKTRRVTGTLAIGRVDQATRDTCRESPLNLVF